MTDWERVKLVATARLLVTEVPPNSNAGPAVEFYQQSTGNKKGDPWCCAFVVNCFDTAGVTFPFTRSGRVQVVVDSAKASQSVHETPQEGDLMVLYYPTLKRYGHIGFVLKVLPDNRVETIEGNTSGAGSRDGWGCFAQNRAVTSHMRFLRWVP